MKTLFPLRPLWGLSLLLPMEWSISTHKPLLYHRSSFLFLGKSIFLLLLMLLLSLPVHTQRVYFLEGQNYSHFVAYDIQQETRLATVELHSGEDYNEEATVLFFNPDKSKVYLINRRLGKISVIDLATFQIEGTINQLDLAMRFINSGYSTQSLQFHPTEPKMYLNGASAIYVINTTDHSLSATISLPPEENCLNFVLNETGSKLLAYSVTHRTDGTGQYQRIQNQNFHIINTNSNLLESSQTAASNTTEQEIIAADQFLFVHSMYFSLSDGKAYSQIKRRKPGTYIHGFLTPSGRNQIDYKYYTFDISNWNSITSSHVDDSVNWHLWGEEENRMQNTYPLPNPAANKTVHISQYSLTHTGSPGYDSDDYLDQITVKNIQTGAIQYTHEFNPDILLVTTSLNIDTRSSNSKLYLIADKGSHHALQSIEYTTGNVENIFDFDPTLEIISVLYLSSGYNGTLVMGNNTSTNQKLLIYVDFLTGTSNNIDVALRTPSFSLNGIYRNNSFSQNPAINVPVLLDYRKVIPSSYAYIPNRTDNTLSVINIGTEAPLGEAVVTIPVGDSPRTVAVSPDNRRVYVGNSEGESLSVIQTYSNTVTQTLPLGSRPAAIAVSPDHKRIAVTTADHPSGNNPKLRILDAKSYAELGSYTVEKDPDALVFGPEGTLYVASHDNSNNGVIDVIDAAGVQQADIPLGVNFRPEAMTLLSEGSTSKLFVAGASNPGKLIEIPLANPSTLSTTVVGQSPKYITIAPDGTKLCILESDGSLHFYDIGSKTLTAYASSTCTSPGGMSLSKDGTHLFISCTDEDIVKDIDLTTQTTGTDIMVGDAPVSKGNFVAGIIPEEYVTALHPTAYITNSGDDNVSVINTERMEVVATIAVGDHPEGVAVSPDSKRVYITNNEGNSVSVINTITNQVIKTIDVGEEPMGICVHPNGSEVYVANLGVPGGTAPNYTATYGSISVIDANSLTVSRTISNVYNPYGICTDKAGEYLYVSNYYSSSVSVYNTSTGTPYSADPTIPVGDEPCGILMREVEDKKFLYVANHASNTVSEIELQAAPALPIVRSMP
ncbi:MAG: hypothetical protein AAGH79_01160, partial [Bacteroidota bacterium]